MTNEIVYTNIELDEILTSATIEKGMKLAQPSKIVQALRSIDYRINQIFEKLKNIVLYDDWIKVFNQLLELNNNYTTDIESNVNKMYNHISNKYDTLSVSELPQEEYYDLIFEFFLNGILLPLKYDDEKNRIIIDSFFKSVFRYFRSKPSEQTTTESKDIAPIHIDLTKTNQLNESFLRMFGTAIEMIVGRMFGKDVQLPYLTISGSPQQMQALTDTLSKEKRYVDSYVKYGLDDPRTYQDQYKLQNAINNFEKETGIKWPIK